VSIIGGSKVAARKLLQNSWKRALRKVVGGDRIFSSSAYWEERYLSGGTSGNGSYGELATFKASVINAFVRDNGIGTVVEFGCGDGNQAGLLEIPRYVGYDVSHAAVALCAQKNTDPGKTFLHLDAYQGEVFDLALSLDVIYHLVEESVFDAYMRRLFNSASRFVCVYSTNHDCGNSSPRHMRHRAFSQWMERHAPEWRLFAHIPNKYPHWSTAEFYFYAKGEAFSSWQWDSA
jgi:SAM-dependent methyltransferase